MLPITAASVRLFIHVIAATVWVGGQLTLAGLLPTLRALGPNAPRAAAQQFNRIAWPAFGVLVATGIWNLFEVRINDASSAYQVTVFVKLFVVAISGVAAYLHTQARTRQGLAIWGALGALATIVALFLGVLLRASA